MTDAYNVALERSTAAATVKFAATLVIGAIVIVALYLGREVFVPISLAILFCFILAPLVRLLRHLGAGRFMSVLAVVGGAAFGAAVMVAIVSMQISQLALELPRYQGTIESKTASLKQMKIFGFTIAKATDALNKVGAQLGDTAAVPADDFRTPSSAAPIAVEVHQLPMSPIETFKIVLGPVFATLAGIGIVVLFVISILSQREDVRDRAIRLSGVRDLTRATAAMDDAAGRLSRLLLMQSAINACFGLLIGVGLWLIGVPNPILWGVFTAFMRFVPFIGSWIAAGIPLLLAAAVDPGWTMLFETIGLFLVADLAIGQFVEPRLHGQSTGLSPLAIVVAATFWTALWGPLGLVLSTPLTVCLATLGRHIEHLAFFDVLFGDEPALSAPQGFYQRILAEDVMEATDQAEAYLKDHSLEDYLDDVVIAGLALAVLDLRAGNLEKQRLPALAAASLQVIDNVFEEHAGPVADEDAEEPAPVRPIVCFSGTSPLDDLAATMLVRLLRIRGLDASVAKYDALTRQPGSAGKLGVPGVLCISQFSPGTHAANPGFLLRRLRRANPDADFVLCLWAYEGASVPANSIDGSNADHSVATLKQTLELCAASVLNNK